MPTKSKKILTNAYLCLLTVIVAGYRLARSTLGRTQRGADPHRIVLLISRPQDVELLIGLHDQARSRKELALSIWMLEKCARRFPDVLPMLEEKGVVVDQFVNNLRLLTIAQELMRADGFLSTVESTAAKHKLPYILTRMANAAGIATYTLQHGFENIGLTYRDQMHGPEIKFAARTILTWGPTTELPSWVEKETRDKAIAVGCPKKFAIVENKLAEKTGERPIVGVFDNLHWHRYDDKYRSAFLRDLQAIADQRREFRFILKSHPVSVRKRDKDLAATLRSMDNLEVADLCERGKAWTTPWLLSQSLGVITTPSTIALDGALAKVPVAVARYGLDLDYYRPLSLFDNIEEWHGFLDGLTEEVGNSRLKLQGERFVGRVLVSGDPSEKILDLMVGGH